MNAVILAAGMGHRMPDVTLQGHKAFLPIGRTNIIERLIQYLKDANIHDITIIIGHKKELFLPLKKKYNVHLIYNKKYALNNNLHSLEMVLDKIGDTFIIHADVALYKNVFKIKEDHTFIYTVFKESKGVPILHPQINKERMIQYIDKYAGNDTVTTPLGIAFWSKKDVLYLHDYFQMYIDEKMKRKPHVEWEEEILKLSQVMPIEARQLDRKYAKDVNLISEYLEACYVYDQQWKY